MSVMPAEQTGSVAAVLADWEGDDSGEGLALVIFERWETVRALYALVGSQETIRRAIMRSEAFRVLGSSIEVDSADVRVWVVESVGRLGRTRGLGDGVLLGEDAVAAVRRGAEVERPILEVCSDGMLLVKAGDGEGWATIDLTALAVEARGR